MKDLIVIPSNKSKLEITENSGYNSIDPFSEAEAKVILKAFENHHQYCHYKPLVHFLFLTGCRSSEAVSLSWEHISSDLKIITFQDAIVSASGNLIKKRLKNKDVRKFPCNQQLQDLLSSIKPNDKAEGIVFKSLDGKIIRTRVFNALVWNQCTIHGKKYIGLVRQLANDGKIHHYRPQYQTRHTFITCMINAGMEVRYLAQLVGNSPEIIYKYYAGLKPGGFIIPSLDLDV
ncbi:MAG: tyrosine-type recombinase/integrase [Calothrix sp. FI2-JRJ7]|nr:tyrosine-type recombinase/integrase [Calothrix sp. FI2-JRJ7]